MAYTIRKFWTKEMNKKFARKMLDCENGNKKKSFLHQITAIAKTENLRALFYRKEELASFSLNSCFSKIFGLEP